MLKLAAVGEGNGERVGNVAECLANVEQILLQFLRDRAYGEIRLTMQDGQTERINTTISQKIERRKARVE